MTLKSYESKYQHLEISLEILSFLNKFFDTHSGTFGLIKSEDLAEGMTYGLTLLRVFQTWHVVSNQRHLVLVWGDACAGLAMDVAIGCNLC